MATTKRLFSLLLSILVVFGMFPVTAVQVFANQEPEDYRYDSFQPGIKWLDTDGNFIQAHGGGIQAFEIDGQTTYYWYGEDKTHGRRPIAGVHAYSSTDLYNWKDEGVALAVLDNREQLDTDPYFQSLYGDETGERRDWVYFNLRASNCIVERPKVIYNETTGKYVMWFHADGPDTGKEEDPSASRYSRAMAGVAVSDSPNGPFKLLDVSRLHYVEGWYPSKYGMARDMTVFQEEDGTAYIVYSSEENAQMYISRLSEDYLSLDKPQGEAVRGVDFAARVLPDTSRESPAIFKYKGMYYMLTSGTTGWSPNPTRYYMTDDILSDKWTAMGDPFVGDSANNSFRSQPTFVLPIDAEKGQFIYMGDRWRDDGGSEYPYLAESTYVWLPISFTSDDRVQISYYDEWTLEDLKDHSKLEVNLETLHLYINDISSLPDTISVKYEGQLMETPVAWTGAEAAVSVIGAGSITGVLTELDGYEATLNIVVHPRNLVYFANPHTGELTDDYTAIMERAADTVINGVNDQAYNPASGNHWGYLKNNSTVRADNSDMYQSLRYINSSTDRTIEYRFDNLEPGFYTVHIGFYDPWAQYANGNRRVRVELNGTTVESSRNISGSYETATYTDQTADEAGSIHVAMASVNTGSNTDIQFSWIMISKQDGEPIDLQVTEESIVSGYLNDVDSLPGTVKVLVDGEEADAVVAWTNGAEALALPGFAQLRGTLTDYKDYPVAFDITVLPRKLVYFANPSQDPVSEEYGAIVELAADTLLHTINEQVYDPDQGAVWGYVANANTVLRANTTNIFESMRYSAGGSGQDPTIQYYFGALPSGSYTVHVGFYDPWAAYANDRDVTVTINESVVDSGRRISGSYEMAVYEDVAVGADGQIHVHLAPVNSGTGSDIMVSWIMVTEEQLAPSADKTALLATITEAEAIDPAEYTAESYSAMLEILADAKGVEANPASTQGEVDAAVEALRSAIDALIPAEVEEVPVESIDLKAGSLNMLSIGKTLELNPTILPENATDKTVTYSSNNPNVASVDEDGVVTAHKTGTALITATASNGKVSKTTVRVTY